MKAVLKGSTSDKTHDGDADGWTADLCNPPDVEESNRLIGPDVMETMNRVASVLAYYSQIDPGTNPEAYESLGTAGDYGRYMVLNLILDTAQDALQKQGEWLDTARMRTARQAQE